MSKKSSSGGGMSLNRILHTLCFVVLFLVAVILALELISINGRTLLQIIHLDILKQIKELLLLCAVVLGAFPFAMRCKKGWRITYWIIVIIIFVLFIFGWIHPINF